MALLEWRDDFRVGIAAVDHEHEELVAQINRLHTDLLAGAGGEAGGDAFGGLYAAISSHFALEEKLMRTHNYDQYAEHKADHERLLDDIREIMEAYERGGDAVYPDRLSSLLRDWFGVHFKTMDPRLHHLLGASHG
ncbi:MAG: bacteriohemerythrin [Azospirillum sp.]|nr:bacteriohemerythrin [Azospirillum sp.]